MEITTEMIAGTVSVLTELARDKMRDQKKLQGILETVLDISRKTLAEIEGDDTDANV